MKYGVARRKKERLDPVATRSRGLVDIGFDLLDRPHPIPRAVFVDHAKGAAVVGAADRCLDQQRSGLARRSVYRPFESHRLFFSSFLFL